MVGVFKHSLFVILKHEMMGPIDVVLEVIETITQKRVSGIAKIQRSKSLNTIWRWAEHLKLFLETADLDKLFACQSNLGRGHESWFYTQAIQFGGKPKC